MSLLSKTTVALIDRARAIWETEFGGTLIGLLTGSHKLTDLPSDGPEGVVVALELARAAKEAAGMCTFTAADLLDNNENVKHRLDALRAIQAAANNPEVQSLVSGFRSRLRQSAASFEAADKINTAVEDDSLGELLLTAQQEYHSLRIHQYSQGEGRRATFHLNGWIYAFPTMHELVCAVARQPVDGLTLCIVLDPDIIEYSVFAWALKTGTTVTVLSQHNGLSHRGQKFLRRNPGRDFERRAKGCYYPYSIFAYRETPTASGSGSQCRIAGMFANGTAPAEQAGTITTHDIAFHKIRPVRDLEPEEITWLLLIADLIRHDYWEQGKKTPELAYTGEMVETPLVVPALLGASDSGPLLLTADREPAEVLPAGAYMPITLPTIDAVTLAKFGHDGSNWEGPFDAGYRTGVNDWMADRYGPSVHTPALSYLPKEVLALPSAEHPADDDFFERCKRQSAGQPEMPLRPVVPITTDNSVTSHSVYLLHDGGWGWRSTPIPYKIQPFQPAGIYGTKAEIERERFFVARQNQSEAIQALADKEFSERASEIVEWFQRRVRTNLPSLKRAIGAGHCKIPTRAPTSSFSNKTVIKDRDILGVWGATVDNKPSLETSLSQIMADCHCGISKGDRWKYRCVEDSSNNSRCFAIFTPVDAISLAYITGLTPAELPDVLQHWRSGDHEIAYTGNPIINLIDPLEQIDNPWQRMEFRVRIHFSRRTFKRWEKGEFRDSPLLKIELHPWDLPSMFHLAQPSPRTGTPS